MRSGAKRAAFIAVDVFIIVMVVLSGIFGIFEAAGTLWQSGARRFVYFTIDSNVLAALSALIALPFKFRRLIRGRPLPTPLLILDLTSTCAVTVTFLTVIFFLGPTLGFSAMYVGNSLWLHMICPLLCIASFVFDAESDKRIRIPYALFALLPVLVYGAVYFTEVIIVGGWRDFYGFNAGGLWYVSAVVMLAATFLIALGLRALENAVSGIRRKR
ncbi:MAG: hypothetical protein J5585_04815 [Clostridia bacterium]|nr:hypothetical protein [Clostridia bacterium]